MNKSALVPLLLLAGCHSDPTWARISGYALGERTVTGTPASAKRLASRPVIDGKLDDPSWASSSVIGPLVDPRSGADVGEHPVWTIARIGWDDSALYLGMLVRDKAASSPFKRDDVDPHIWGAASGVELMLQPGDPGDNRDYYELQVDVAGAVWDTHFDDYNSPAEGSGPTRTFGHQEWSSKVERAVHAQAGRFYSVELALPWSSLTGARVPVPPRAGDVWRLNLYSFRDGQRQALAWSPIKGQGNFHRAAWFGRIRFE